MGVLPSEQVSSLLNKHPWTLAQKGTGNPGREVQPHLGSLMDRKGVRLVNITSVFCLRGSSCMTLAT